MEVPFAGYDKRFEPLYTLDATPGAQVQKVTLIVGSADRLMKADDMRALAAKQSKLVDKTIFVVENPDRKDNFDADRAAYAARLVAAFGK